MTQLLSRDAILKAQDLPTQDVAVPEWGGAVRVRALTGAERDAFEASITTGKGKNLSVVMENVRAKLVAMTVVDGEGKRVFSDEDARELGRKSAAALDRVFKAHLRLLENLEVDRTMSQEARLDAARAWLSTWGRPEMRMQHLPGFVLALGAILLVGAVVQLWIG